MGTDVEIDIEQIDLADLDNFAEGPPWQLFGALRRHCPIHWNPLPDEPGFWSVTRYHDLAVVNQDWETFSSGRRGVFIRDEQTLPWEVAQHVLLNQDPPRHTQTRGTVQRFFTAGAVAKYEPRIRAIVTELIDRVIERGAAELVADVAVDLPMRVIGDMLGVPAADQRRVMDLVMQIGDPAGMDEEGIRRARDAALKSFGELGGYVYELVQERRARPRDDLISQMIAADLDGRRLTDVELTSFIGFLMSAGSEEVRNTYSGGMRALITHPDQRRLLIRDPSRIPQAVEEILRYHSAIIHQRRTATREVELSGVRINEGDKVVMWLASGNHDETVFADPERLNVLRQEPIRHQAFGGGGRHFCLGNQLARLELRVLFEETLQRMPDMELAGPVEYKRSNFFHGLTKMPVSFTPARASH